MVTISKAKALRRLTLDWEELQRDPVPACSAYPVSDDWLEWHADLSTVDGPMAGVSIHAVLRFDADYPRYPPRFEFPSDRVPSFRHPNLYGRSFCCDILHTGGHQSGWTPAYTVRGLIQQLSTFIFHRADSGRGSEIWWHSETVAAVRREARAIRCSCRSVAPAPVCEPVPAAPLELPPAARAAAGELAQQLRLPTWFLLQTLDALDGPGLLVFGQVCRAWRRAAVRAQLLARRETRCYFTKQASAEAILGVGLTAQWHSDGNLRRVDVVLDVLSAEAFDAGVRRGAYGEEFDDFLPLALEPRHFQRARPRIEAAIALVATQGQRGAAFAPWMALTVLPAAMNAFVVSLMQQGEKAGRIPRHASERALWGYCSLHHLLLALAETYPDLKAIAAGLVKNFVASPASRTKASCPDLGQLLVLQTLAAEPWDKLAPPLLAEAMARNVMWVEREVNCYREDYRAKMLTREGWFQRTLTSKRLLMFQAAFLRHTPRPEDALATYAARFGQPTEAAQAAVLKAARSILKVNSWRGFFPMFGLPVPARLDASVDALTAASVQRSEECGYTGAQRKPAKAHGGWKARLERAAKALRPAEPRVDRWQGAAATAVTLFAAPTPAETPAAPPAETPAAPPVRSLTEVLADARRELAAHSAHCAAARMRELMAPAAVPGARPRMDPAAQLASARRALEARARRELLEEARAELASVGADEAQRSQELAERIAAIEAQEVWQAQWGEAPGETRVQWLGRLGQRMRTQAVLCRSFEREGRCTYRGGAWCCRYLHVPPKPDTLPLVAARARELEAQAEQSGPWVLSVLHGWSSDGLPEPPKAPVEEASTTASDAGVTDSSAPSAALVVEEVPSEEVAPEEDVAASESVEGALVESPARIAAKRRRALGKKLRAIDVLIARGSLTQEEEAKVQRRSDLERELAELE